jgi:hypothetical protein
MIPPGSRAGQTAVRPEFTLWRISTTQSEDDRNMALSKQTLAVAVVGLASLTWVGVSAATEDDDPVLSDNVEVVTETTETTQPTATSDTTDTTEAPETTVATEDGTDDLEADDAPPAEHPENHGKHVSEAAHTCPPGPGHGACVREVAQSDVGKSDDAEATADDAAEVDDADAAEGDDDTAVEADDADEDEVEGTATEDGRGEGEGGAGRHGASHGKG